VWNKGSHRSIELKISIFPALEFFSASLCHFRLIFHSTPLGFRISIFNLLRSTAAVAARRDENLFSQHPPRYILLNLFRSRIEADTPLFPNHE
jgi:hypothetical protein